MVSVWYYRLARKIYVAVKTYYISLYALRTKGFRFTEKSYFKL